MPEERSEDEQAGAEFEGPSEMHGRVRSLDWARTPVGPVSEWPQSLKSTVRTLLSSRYPMVLTWGPEFTQFYNDAYSALIGDKHPGALGGDIRVTLAAGWATLGPMIERVMRTGVANWTPALPLLMERAGYREEAYFSVSHAPAEDDEGRTVGMLAVCSEVTQQVLGERRLRLLRDLASRAGEARSVEETCGDLVAAVSAHPLDVPFCLLYLRDGDGGDGGFSLGGAVGLPEGGPASPRHAPPDADAPWPLASAASGGEAAVLAEGVAGRGVDVAGGLWGEPVTSALVMPLAAASPGAPPLGVLVAGVSPSRALDEGYRSFFELLAGQAAVALRNARAHEEERRRAEALAELDRAKTEFFANVSHEFRTPLTLMLGPVEGALSRPEAGGRALAGEDLEAVHRNGLRLLKLVNSLLDFSRIEAGRAEATLEPTDLAAYTAELASAFRSAVERAGLTFTVDCPPLPEPVWLDRGMWEKVVFNLLSNALKFTFAGGIRVAVRPAEDGRAAELTVEDTGTGIAEEELPRIFERFHRGRGAHGRTHEGTGIGLALVRELTRLHGGDVRAASAYGRGSVFTIAVPFGTAHLPSERLGGDAGRAALQLPSTDLGAAPFVEEALRWLPGTASSTEEAAPSGGDAGTSPATPDDTRGARVLVADDNADMRDYLTRLLSAAGYAVEAVGDGAAALEAAAGRAPDLIVSDVMMPRMDGFELLARLRADTALRATPVLLLSARAGEESSVEGMAAGADDYLVKPFAARELLARVRANIHLSRVRREATASRQQREFLRQVLASVTEGRLRLCLDEADLPAPLPPPSGGGGPVALADRTLRDARLHAARAAQECGFDKDRANDLLTGVGEAAMNAVRHAGGGEARVCADPAAGVVQVWVADRGGGIDMARLPRATLERGYTGGGGLGHGFWLLLQCCDRVFLRTGPGGTTVVLEQERTPPAPSWL